MVIVLAYPRRTPPSHSLRFLNAFAVMVAFVCGCLAYMVFGLWYSNLESDTWLTRIVHRISLCSVLRGSVAP
jgi:hypothetical protein